MHFLVKNWLVDAKKTEMAHLWAAVNVWLKYLSCLVELLLSFIVLVIITFNYYYHLPICSPSLHIRSHLSVPETRLRY